MRRLMAVLLVGGLGAVVCDGVTNVIDVVKFVNVAFRGGDAGVEFCEGCVP